MKVSVIKNKAEETHVKPTSIETRLLKIDELVSYQSFYDATECRVIIDSELEYAIDITCEQIKSSYQ